MYFLCLIINVCIFYLLQDGKYFFFLLQMFSVGGIGVGGFVDFVYLVLFLGIGQQFYNDWLGEDFKKQVYSQFFFFVGFNLEVFFDFLVVFNSTFFDFGNFVGGSLAGGEDVDFDDLIRRFE